MTTPKLSWRLLALAAGCLIIVVAAVMATGAPVGVVLGKLLSDSFSNPISWGETLKRFTPYAIIGVAVFWGLRAGLFNIGVEGQFLLGGMVGMVLALQVGGLPGILLGCLAGAIAGALWALPAAWIRAYRGGHEVISTIMLNQIAIQLAAFLLAGPIQDPDAGTPTTRALAPESMLGGIPMGPVTLSFAVLVAGLIVIGFDRWLRSTVSGYELSVTGANATAGEFAGIQVKRVLFQAMLGSGAVAGLAGGLQAVAYEGRFYGTFSSGYGFDALGVAILAGANPLGILPSAFAFAVIGQGANAVQFENVPKGISSVILALLIVVFAAARYRQARSNDV